MVIVDHPHDPRPPSSSAAPGRLRPTALDAFGARTRARPDSTLWFHRATPADTDDLHDLYERLSPEARRRRFFQPMPRVRRSTAAHLCSVDPSVHLVWLARLGSSTGPVIGEVQAAIERDDPTVAELALAVDDDWTGRGVGRALVRLIHDVAAHHGISTFTAEVLSENRACVDLLASFGMRFRFADGVLGGRGPVQQWSASPTWTTTVPSRRTSDLARSA